MKFLKISKMDMVRNVLKLIILAVFFSSGQASLSGQEQGRPDKSNVFEGLKSVFERQGKIESQEPLEKRFRKFQERLKNRGPTLLPSQIQSSDETDLGPTLSHEFESSESLSRPTASKSFFYTNDAFCHRQLLFEELALEKFGIGRREVVQPVISTGKFLVNSARFPLAVLRKKHRQGEMFSEPSPNQTLRR